MARIEQRLESLENALQILLRAERAVQIPDLEEMPSIVKIKNDIQGIKMRMGKA
jgi:hypothetical protein